jgi:hypothetical protein
MDGTPVIEPNVVTNLTNALIAAGYNVPTPVLAVPGSLTPANYKQVWDIRYSTPLTPSDVSAYVAYLAAGGSLFVVGENVTDEANRDGSVVNLIQSAGGGNITVVNASNVETVLSPFTGPDPVTAITFIDAGGSATTGTGSFVTKDTNNDGIGTGIVWPPGSLVNGRAGTLITVFDINFMETIADANSQALLANLIGYLNAPPAPPATVPTLSETALVLAAFGLMAIAAWRLGRRRPSTI